MASISSAGSPSAAAQALRASRKIVVVTFGGGARDEETFSENGQQNIPCMMNELAPQGCFFSQVLNRGILGHYVATASIATGGYEVFDNFVAQRPSNPTLFEYFRYGLQRPIEDAWLIAPSANFLQMDASSCRNLGPRFGAQLVLPKQLLQVSMAERGKQWDPAFDLLRDNYESDYYPMGDMPSVWNDAAARINERLNLAQADFQGLARKLLSPDELSLFVAKRIMKRFAPSMLFLTFHDIDVAHLGAFSLYLDAVRRTDGLCGEIWRAIQSDSEYKDRTTLFIMPDFGRDGDGETGGNGFQHHRTGSAMARTTWMLVLGPAARPGSIVDRPVESIDLVPTIGGLMGFPTPQVQGRRIPELA